MLLKKYAASCLLFLVLLQAGCATRPPTASESLESKPSKDVLSGDTAKDGASDEKLYTIRIDQGLKLVFDSNGNEIPPERQFIVLYDEVTGQPQCQKRVLSEDTGKDNEYGQPILRRTTALYDRNGNLLHDFKEIDYDGGFDDFLIRHDPRGFVLEASDLPENYHTELWNYKTGEVVFDGVGTASPMNDKATKFLMTDAYGYLLGVTDRDGAVISGFPAPEGYYYSSAWNGMIISYRYPFDSIGDNQQTMSLLREDLTPVATYESINAGYIGLRGDYLLFREGNRSGIMDTQGKEVYAAPEEDNLSYFDGELAILGKRTVEDDQSPNFSLRLVTADGTELAAGYDVLQEIEGIDEAAPAKDFIAIRGNVVEMISRDGTVTASKEFADITGVQPIGDGLFTYQTNAGGEGLFNENLDLLLDPKIYSWIHRSSVWENGVQHQYDLLQCSYQISDDQQGAVSMRSDLLDLSLNKIVGGLTQVSDIGPNRIAVVRGFSAGLMDWEGNWVVKKSIFQNLSDDYSEWSASL